MQGLWLQILMQYLALADFMRMYMCESAVKQRLMQQQQDMLCMHFRGRSLHVTYFGRPLSTKGSLQPLRDCQNKKPAPSIWSDSVDTLEWRGGNLGSP